MSLFMCFFVKIGANYYNGPCSVKFLDVDLINAKAADKLLFLLCLKQTLLENISHPKEKELIFDQDIAKAQN